jgi:hypothetical protein
VMPSTAESHRQDRLRSIQRLNLALFVNTEHQRVIGRVEREPYDIAHLLDETRIGGELESARAMRLNGKSLKEAMNGGFRNPALLGRFPDGPMGSRLGLSR